MYRFIIFLALLPALLLADSPPTANEIFESTHTPLTTIYGAPETNIFGVNVINGDYNYSCIDFNQPGADPLIFQRVYRSSKTQLRAFFNGWEHNFSSYAREYGNDVTLTGAVVGSLPFQKNTAKNEDWKINRKIFKKGVTNCGRGKISGRSNIKNMRVQCIEDGIKAIHSDGTEHLHRKIARRGPKLEFYPYNGLAETIKPNGMKTTYVTSPRVLDHVRALNCKNETLNEIKFNCPDYQVILMGRKAFRDYDGSIQCGSKVKETDFSITGTSNDGKTAKYSFHCTRKYIQDPNQGEIEGFIIMMSQFESSHLPTEKYEYMERDDGFEMLAERKGEHHRTKIDYYESRNTVDIYGKASEEVNHKHIAYNRVKQIRVAVDTPEDLQILCNFSYHKDQRSKDSLTDIYNHKKHLTRFHYSTKNYRLNCVERYKGTSPYTVYRRDRLQYGAKLTALEGDLLFKTVESSDGTVHYGENYEYDDRGNVQKRQLHYRTFTNPKSHSISIKKNHSSPGNDRLHGGEIQTTTYTHNRLNLPTSEDNGRLITKLKYHTRNRTKTNLLKSKFTQDKKGIKRREFYKFDGNTGCTLKIEDDGSSTSSDNLEGVNSRRVTHFKNREDQFAGLPLEIDTWGSDGEKEGRISRTVLGYDSHGYVEQETHYDANNIRAYEVHKIRDLQGNITSETDPEGYTTTRKYSKYGSLSEEQGPNLSYLMEYTYDWLQRPVKETRKCVDKIDLTVERKYDLEGNLTEIMDPYGFKTEFIYNEQGRPTEIIYPPVRVKNGKWVRPREHKEYNFLGHLISETDAKGAITLYTPNDAGLPLEITYPDGTSEQFLYSIYGEVLEKTQRNGSKIVYGYDDFSRLTSETIYDCNGTLLKKSSREYTGLLLSFETDGEGLTTSYTYDYAGRVFEIHRGNAFTKNLYDPLGRLEEEQRYFGKGDRDYIATKFTYDLLNRVRGKEETDSEGQAHSKTETTYDSDGNIATTTAFRHAGSATTIYTYDARGHITSIEDALGRKTHYNHRYNFYFRKKNLPCMEVTDPTGVKTTTISTPGGAVIMTEVHSPFGELLSKTEMFYDLKGNVVKKEEHLPKETIVTLWEYDSCSRLVQQINGFDTPEQMTTTFIYNSFGELSEIQYSDETSKHRTYDGLGRLREEWSDDKSIHYEYTYNRQDLLKRVLDCNTKQETIRKYTPEGNLKSEELENGLKMTYEYDRMNRLIECTYPDGSSVKQTYNPVYLTKTERIKNDSVIYSSTYKKFDQSGKPAEIVFPKSSGKLSFTYDQLNRPKRLSYPHYKEEKIRYDKRGIVESKRVNGDLQTFTHDHLQQLTLEKTAQYTHSYENDALHRQISVDGNAQKHNAVHQLTHGIHDEYKYDAKGRRKHDSATRYTYDKFDRLIKAEQGDLTCTYTYDAFNRKMTRTSGTETIRYLYNGLEEIGSFRNKKCLDLKILSSREGSLPIAIELGEQQYAPIISTQGHIVGLVVMETGKLADLSPLTMFGKDLAENPLSPWRFCGKRHEEAALGIIDFGYRFYHPKSAQWLTPDPLGESAGPNLYAYVSNNPARFVDRFGLLEGEFSFSNAWDSFKDTCSNCWDSFKDSCSNTWDSVRDTFSSGSSEYSSQTWDTKSVIGGISHGAVDFLIGSLHDLQIGAACIGSFESEMDLNERTQMMQGIEQSQQQQMAAVGSWITSKMEVDESNALYHSCRSKTTMGLAIGSLAAGGYGAVKGVIGVTKLLQTSTKIAKQSTKPLRGSNGFLGHRGFELKNPSYQPIRNSTTNIQGRTYSGHALDQMQNRGFTPSIIEQTIKEGAYISGKNPGTMAYYDNVNGMSVILNNKGDIVTISHGVIRQ